MLLKNKINTYLYFYIFIDLKKKLTQLDFSFYVNLKIIIRE